MSIYIGVNIKFNTQVLKNLWGGDKDISRLIKIVKKRRDIKNNRFLNESTFEYAHDSCHCEISNFYIQEYDKLVKLNKALGGKCPRKIVVALPDNFIEAHRMYTIETATLQRKIIHARINKETFCDHLINYIRKNKNCIIN